ncbi:acyltransferase family protein [Demequina sediminicola]|uniref:acyltransferase family protein n=1 Tax=Demequina sediminicola TaxID=1095026 RepID=UPI00078593C2|nr:acyltransferase family protein [Demequina sediminicola]
MTASTSHTAGVRRTERDRSVDSLAGVLIILVVFSHAIEPLEGQFAETAAQWLFMFHMPAFVFVSGYVTRYSSRWAPGRTFLKLAFPYVVFTLAQAVFNAALTGEPLSVSFLTPSWTLWYLVALGAWRLSAPLLRSSWWVVPGLAIAGVALGTVGMVGQELSVERIVCFAPFFAAGLMWRDSWWPRIRAARMRVLAVAALAGALVWSWFSEDTVIRSIFFLSESYADIGQTNGEGMAQRAAVLVAGAVLTLAILALSGGSNTVVASIGAATLPVYLLHPLVLYPAHLDGYGVDWPESLMLLGLMAFAAGFSYVVSRPAVVRATRPLMDYMFWRDLVRR